MKTRYAGIRTDLLWIVSLVALLATGCASSVALRTRTPTPTLTPFSWMAATYPPGFHLPGEPNETRIALASADIAYAITDTGAPSAPLEVYVTHTRAANWTRVATLPILLRDASAWAPTLTIPTLW